MKKCGLSESFINILLNMYSSLKTCVKLDNGLTPDFFSSIGVRQGCPLSPSLFNLFLNDLPEIFTNECVPVMLDSQNISVLMYADDIVLLPESPIGLQNCLNNLLEYCLQWKLSVNLKKTKVIIFNINSNSLAICRNNDFYFNNNKIEQVRSYEYLGIIFQENGDFSLAIKNLY